jgi:hemoglobin
MNPANLRRAVALALTLLSALLAGCAGAPARDREFQTSGSREADQRAEQRITKERQMRGEEGDQDSDAPKPPLFERLGGRGGIDSIVEDFVVRAMADPRVNWERKGVTRGGVLGIGARSAEWKPSDANVAKLKEHLKQFLTLASGGPSEYTGRDIEEVHAGMNINNAEFDATVGDLKATLDALGIAIGEQKELLAIFESTRPQIVEER